MGKKKDEKYIIISGFAIDDNNRGTAALGYGAVYFMKQQGFLMGDDHLLNIRVVKNLFNPVNRHDYEEYVDVCGMSVCHKVVNVFFLEYALLVLSGMYIPFTKFGKLLNRTRLIAAINGGDGFSDIYNTKLFLSRLTESKIAMGAKLPLIILPQTLGPFAFPRNLQLAQKVLTYASAVYVRDNRFSKILDSMGVKYEQTKDLSAYMQPYPWNINVMSGAIGLNISGLAYSNGFKGLSGMFGNYKELISQIIRHFVERGKVIYLISHSYNYSNPEPYNDDLEASKDMYQQLEDKSHVILVNKNLTSPQTKYLISQMSFFIGTRMHANFAAIYTGVPVFGLAYSYKFIGAFDANGLDGEKQTVMINNIQPSDIPLIISKIDLFYESISRR